MSKWTDFRDSFESFFISESAKVVAFLKPFALQIESKGKDILIAAAQAAVAVGEATPGGGEAKMLAALAAFSASVVSQGLPYIESEARALIEVALQNIKSSLGSAPAPAAIPSV